MAAVVIAVAVTIAMGVAPLMPTPNANAEVFEGTQGDDHIVGTPQKDLIRARGGDDVVSAGGAGDRAPGGGGDDIIRLGPNKGGGWDGRAQMARNDQGNGQAGNDTIFGGDGVDRLEDGGGRDEMHGGRSGDLLILVPGGPDRSFGGFGHDKFIVETDSHPDLVACGPGNDLVVWISRHEGLDRTRACERERVS